jgi:FixJ family two-component response regulator
VNVLLMSGYSESEVSRDFAGRDIAGFLQKPFNATDLYNAVASALER